MFTLTIEIIRLLCFFGVLLFAIIPMFASGQTSVVQMDNGGHPFIAAIPALDSIIKNIPAKIFGQGSPGMRQVISADTIITPTTGNGFTIDISRFGFTNLSSMNITATAVNNTSTATSIPLVALKSYNTTTLTFNIVMSNSTVVSVLGTSIVSLIIPTTLTGVSVHIKIDGW